MQAVLFDLGNVMIHVHMDRMLAQLGQVLGLTAVDVQGILTAEDLQKRYESGKLSDDEMFAALTKFSRKSVQRAALEMAAADIFTENRAMLPILDQLQELEVELAIVSNTNGIHIRLAESRFDCFSYFANRIYSHEIGVMKPHRRYYEIVAERLRTQDPQQCLFVDDLAENIAGAQEFGFQGHHFTDADNLLRDLRDRGLLINGL